MSREAMKMALEALEDIHGYRKDIDDAIAALRAALAEQPAPVLTDADIVRIAKEVRAPINTGKTAIRFARAIAAAAIPPGCVVVPAGEVEALRKALRQSVVALAWAAEQNPAFNGVYAAVSDVLAARPGGQG